MHGEKRIIVFEGLTTKVETKKVMIKPTRTVDFDGTTSYRLPNGDYHRENGPALIYPRGDKFWYYNGQSHREDGPAKMWISGEKEYYIDGELHREDGPAVYNDGREPYWCLYGEEVTKEEHDAWREAHISI